MRGGGRERAAGVGRRRGGGRRGRENEGCDGGGSTVFLSGGEGRGRWRAAAGVGLAGEESRVEDGERSGGQSRVSVGVLGVGECWRSERRDGLFGGRRTRRVDVDGVLPDGLSLKEGEWSLGGRRGLSDGCLSGFRGGGRSFGKRRGRGRSGLLLLDDDLEDHLDRRVRLLLHIDLTRLLPLLMLLLLDDVLPLRRRRLLLPLPLLLSDLVPRQSNSSLLDELHNRVPPSFTRVPV